MFLLKDIQTINSHNYSLTDLFTTSEKLKLCSSLDIL